MADLVVEDLGVTYTTGGGHVVRPIDGLTATLSDGDLSLLLGPSGSGKTTLLSVLGGILRPTNGSVWLGDTNLTALDEAGLLRHRRDHVGFVFQAFNLVASLTALDNVAAPLMTTGTSRRAARRRAEALLDSVGLADRAHHRPAQLSGGQQQRVAIARGLVRDAPLLLADEPTANLDYVQAEGVISLLRDLATEGRIVIVATHDDRLLPIADSAVDLAPMEDATPEDLGPQEFRKGDVVFRQGTRGPLVYLVRSGSVEIVREDEDGGEERLALRSPGEYFGELGPMMGQPRTATARAAQKSVVVAMTLQDFRAGRRDEARVIRA